MLSMTNIVCSTQPASRTIREIDLQVTSATRATTMRARTAPRRMFFSGRAELKVCMGNLCYGIQGGSEVAEVPICHQTDKYPKQSWIPPALLNLDLHLGERCACV